MPEDVSRIDRVGSGQRDEHGHDAQDDEPPGDAAPRRRAGEHADVGGSLGRLARTGVVRRRTQSAGTRVIATTMATRTTLTPATPMARMIEASKTSRPGQGDRDGEAGEEDGAPGRRHGALARRWATSSRVGDPVLPVAELLAEPAHREQAVVDARGRARAG